MSETMITKAARACLHAAHKHYNGEADEVFVWGSASPELRAASLAQARAVLMAVRSDENGIMNSWIDSGSMDDEHPARIFTAMIDAILAQEPGA